MQAMGKNRYGQLGIGSTDDVLTPTQVLLPNGTRVVSIAAGAFHALFLTEDGEVYATGWNRWGQFGNGGSEIAQTPKRILTGVNTIAAGYGHSLFLLQDKTVQAAGLNQHGQLGDGSTTTRRFKVMAYDEQPVIQIAAGYDFSYFLTQIGHCYATGQNLGGQLGDGTYVTKLRPVRLLLSGVEDITAGESHSLLRTGNWAWGVGAHAHGQLGDSAISPYPVRLSSIDRAPLLVAGGDSTCAGFDAGGMICMGSNLDGQLGLGNAQLVRTPQILNDVSSIQLAIGDTHSLFLQRDWTDVRATGTNGNGELGLGTNESKREFERWGLNLATSTTTSMTATSTTGTVTTITQTFTSLFRRPNSGRDGLTDDLAMMQMLQTLLGMGAVAVLVGLVVRRVAGPEPGSEVTVSEMELRNSVTV